MVWICLHCQRGCHRNYVCLRSLQTSILSRWQPYSSRDATSNSGIELIDYVNPGFHLSWTWVRRVKTGQGGQVRFTSYAFYLSWEIHSKSFMLVTLSSISFAATSLAWTSITIRADNTVRCILDNFPRTRATKSPSWVRKTE